jgi:hypothetical protein
MDRTFGARMALAVVGLSASVSGAAQPLLASQFPARVLAVHNAERAKFGAPPLVWDNQLGAGAAAYAQQMALTGRFEHSDRSTRRGVAESLWMGTRGAYSVEAMLGGWISERRMFVPGVFPNVSRSGNWLDVSHYTQMIWPSTQRVGCALASTGRTDYLVCRYSPLGNIDGRSVGVRPAQPL